MKNKLKISILRVLQACDGVPMPESSLVSGVQIHVRPLTPSHGDVVEALRDIEAELFAEAVSDDLTGEKTWTLTTKGTHKARQLR